MLRDDSRGASVPGLEDCVKNVRVKRFAAAGDRFVVNRGFDQSVLLVDIVVHQVPLIIAILKNFEVSVDFKLT